LPGNKDSTGARGTGSKNVSDARTDGRCRSDSTRTLVQRTKRTGSLNSAKEAATEREVLAALCCSEMKIEMAKQKAQLGARGLHGLVESRPDGGRNQEQKTKNHSLGPNTSDEENYQIRKMKTQRPRTSDLNGKHSHEEVKCIAQI
jgi:hypothetical protein